MWCKVKENKNFLFVQGASNHAIKTTIVLLIGNMSRRGCNFKDGIMKGPINSLGQKFNDDG